MTQELIDFIVGYMKESDDRAMEFLNIHWDDEFDKIYPIDKFDEVCEKAKLTPWSVAYAVLESDNNTWEERLYFQFSNYMNEVHFSDTIKDDDETWETAIPLWIEDWGAEDFCEEFGITHEMLVRRFKEFAYDEYGAVDGGKLDKAAEYTIEELFENEWEDLFEDLYA